jgi:hypothetical protein
MKQKFTSYFWQTQIDVKKATSKDGDGTSDDRDVGSKTVGKAATCWYLFSFPFPQEFDRSLSLPPMVGQSAVEAWSSLWVPWQISREYPLVMSK